MIQPREIQCNFITTEFHTVLLSRTTAQHKLANALQLEKMIYQH